jgi:hypothetical protein
MVRTQKDFFGTLALATILFGAGCARDTSGPPAGQSPAPRQSPPSAHQAPQGPPIAETNNLILTVDHVVETPQGTQIDGWAFIDKADAVGSAISLVLERNGTQSMFPATKVARADVAKAFGKAGLDASGFSGVIGKGALPPGRYRLGLYVKRDGQEGLMYTNKTVSLN